MECRYAGIVGILKSIVCADQIETPTPAERRRNARIEHARLVLIRCGVSWWPRFHVLYMPRKRVPPHLVGLKKHGPSHANKA